MNRVSPLLCEAAVLVARDLRSNEGDCNAGGHKRNLHEIKLGGPSHASTDKRTKSTALKRRCVSKAYRHARQENEDFGGVGEPKVVRREGIEHVQWDVINQDDYQRQPAPKVDVGNALSLSNICGLEHPGAPQRSKLTLRNLDNCRPCHYRQYCQDATPLCEGRIDPLAKRLLNDRYLRAKRTTGIDGFVARTIARFCLTGKMAHDDLVCPATSSRLQSSGTPLALCPLHAKP